MQLHGVVTVSDRKKVRLGNGILISDRHVLTCKHVVGAKRNVLIDADALPAQLLHSGDGVLDLAILELAQPIAHAPTAWSSSVARLGDEVTYIGEGHTGTTVQIEAESDKRITLNAHFEAGDSGGAIFAHSRGHIYCVGILCECVKEHTRSLAIPAKTAEIFCRCHGIPLLTAPSVPGVRTVEFSHTENSKILKGLQIPGGMIPRPAAVAKLRRALLRQNVNSSQRTLFTAVAGQGGAGKTVLASFVMEDPAVQVRFSDGLVAVTIGQIPPNTLLDAEIRQILLLLGDRRDGREFETPQQRLGRLLAEKSILLVLDDVWRVADITWVPQNLKHSAVLFTTQIDGLCKTFPETVVIDAELVGRDDSQHLVAMGEECFRKQEFTKAVAYAARPFRASPGDLRVRGVVANAAEKAMLGNPLRLGGSTMISCRNDFPRVLLNPEHCRAFFNSPESLDWIANLLAKDVAIKFKYLREKEDLDYAARGRLMLAYLKEQGFV